MDRMIEKPKGKSKSFRTISLGVFVPPKLLYQPYVPTDGTKADKLGRTQKPRIGSQVLYLCTTGLELCQGCSLTRPNKTARE
jgi:hypothetical protein